MFKENPNMRHHIVSLAAIGSLALLAACSKTDAPAESDADVAAQVEEKRAELEKLEADLAATQTQTPPASATATAPASSRPAVAAKPATSRPTAPAAPKPAPVAKVTVPAGTELALSLSQALSSKTAKVGDPVRAVLTNAVTVDGRTAIASGTTVAGSIIKVVSGSEKIGGTPTLVLAFDRLELAGGMDVPIKGELTSSGKSDNTRDTVKIVGGAAAGALIGDQVSSKDRGKVIGGILGAAAGAVAARETGTEVQLAEGAALAVVLSEPVEITR
jgi:hypothetical protein